MSRKRIEILPLGLKEVLTHNTGTELGIQLQIGVGRAVWTPKSKEEGQLYCGDDAYEELIADLPDDEYQELLDAISDDVNYYYTIIGERLAKVTTKDCGTFMLGESEK